MSDKSAFPVQACGRVVHGFGRGSKELGIPTANLDSETVELISSRLNAEYGIYYGWAWFEKTPETRYPMVMSFGLNPQYNNERPSVEPHLIHMFGEDFYDEMLCLSIEGYIRGEQKFDSLDALIKRIHEDISYAKAMLLK